MRNIVRNPLTWLVVAEFVVVGALLAVAWNVAGGAAHAALGSPALTLPGAGSDAASPLPDIPEGRPSARGPLPGLNLDSRFWRQRLAQLNGDQAAFEQLEWRIIHSAMDALHRYLETVVMPAVRAAEKTGGPTP